MKVLVVEDVQILCKALVKAFEAHLNVTEAKGATTGSQALDIYREFRPDCILLDIELPDISGLRIGEKVLNHSMHVTLVFMSAFTDQTTVLAAKEIKGISGFIAKSDSSGDFGEYVENVLSAKPWKPYFSPSFNEALKKAHRSEVNLRKQLQPNERRVLSLLAAGLSDEEIGHRLDISSSTVSWKIKQLRQKLNVHSRPDLITIAQKTGCFRSTWFDLNLVDKYDLY